VSNQHQRCGAEVRAEAAYHLRRFRDGEITNDEFEDAYLPLCHQAEDRALRAIATAVWPSYSDLHEHKLPPLDAEAKAFFDRCILFLRSDLPYEWERDILLGIRGLGWITRRLSVILKRVLGTTPKRLRLHPGPDSKADWSIWPFQNQQDISRIEAEIGNSNP
jgi:hypothetical protein